MCTCNNDERSAGSEVNSLLDKSKASRYANFDKTGINVSISSIPLLYY